MDLIMAVGLLALIIGIARAIRGRGPVKDALLFDPAFDPARVRLALTAMGHSRGEDPYEEWLAQVRDPEYRHEPFDPVELVPPPDFDLPETSREFYSKEFVDLLDAKPLDLETGEVVAPIEVTGPSPTTFVPFGRNEPQRLDEYVGQHGLIELLKVKIKALPDDQRVIDHRIFTGVPGMGKTLLAKIITNELNIRAESLGLRPLPLFESFAVDLDSVAAFDKQVKRIEEAGGGVWFIDETHVLGEELATKLYPLMTDGRYSYHGSSNTVYIPDVVVLGATTDYGKLHGALKRRFGEPLRLRPATPDDLKQIISGRDFPITEEAVDAIVAKTKFSGAPWESIELFNEAEDFARAEDRLAITPVDVERVFRTYEIDELGLRWVDREVIRAMFDRPNYRGKDREFVCYGASEADVCAAAGLDVSDYRDTVKGRLLARGLIEVKRGYGQALTERAVNVYEHAFHGA